MRFGTFFYYILLIFTVSVYAQPNGGPLLQKGWAELVKDNDDAAYRYFWAAYEKSKKENNIYEKAEALLYLGICSFGSNPENGLRYATEALAEFKKIEKIAVEKGIIGRSKCLQLISTIYYRNGHYKRAIDLSREVIRNMMDRSDRAGTVGLAYTTLGTYQERLNSRDSALHFYTKALNHFIKNDNEAYLPTAYLKLGNIGPKAAAMAFYNKGFDIAVRSNNRQAQVMCLLQISKNNFETGNYDPAERQLLAARKMAQGLSDQSFEISVVKEQVRRARQRRDYVEASLLQDELLALKDSSFSVEQQKIVKQLEVQFELFEKNRTIELLSKERQVTALTNSFLIAGVISLCLILAVIIFFFKKISRRDKLLLLAKEHLVNAMEVQRKLEEEQFQNDLEHKETQLSAVTLQMVQKNELLKNIKSAIADDLSKSQLLQMVDVHLSQDNWEDFDLYFESINKNFYSRIKDISPDISSNDLKLCALIKLNLSIKEMAAVLNISPDSVKTARYRLRKKFQLRTEDNLSDFVLKI